MYLKRVLIIISVAIILDFGDRYYSIDLALPEGHADQEHQKAQKIFTEVKDLC